MWLWISILLFGMALLLHFFWAVRVARLREELHASSNEINRLKAAEQAAAAQTQARLEAVFNSMIEGFLLLDSDGTVVAINPSLERIFSLDQDIRGRTLLEAFRLHELVELAERVQRERQVRNFQIRLPGIQDQRYLEVNAAALTSSSEGSGGSVFIFHDVTRLFQLENMRKEFVANVSHELRTPLTMIKGYVETLLDGAKNDPALCEKFLRTIDKHSNRLALLLEDLLTISRLESGQIVLQKTRIQLHQLVGKVLEEFQSAAAQKMILLKNQVPPGEMVWADPGRLEQVLSNLVDNSIKYGKAGGYVAIHHQRTPEGLTQIAVRDNGPGIPPESLERIFERFYRVDRARSREAGGTGLGLSIVKHIIQSHGGEVWAESVSGQGASFFFTLPEQSLS